MMFKRTVTRIIIALLLLFSIVITASAVFFYFVTKDANIDKLLLTNSQNISKLYDDNCKIVNCSNIFNKYVPFEDISEEIITAFVVLEDKRFFSHRGLDYTRILGALINNIKKGYLSEGGSTITQQLIKNTFLTNEKTFKRKLKEAKLAKQIEKSFSKNEILTMYLNAIYFGDGIYGILRACEIFFNKKPSQIDIFEASLLAGIVKNPGKNSPILHPDNANNRKNIVLGVLLKNNAISNDEYLKGIEYIYKPPQKQKVKLSSSYLSAVFDEASIILNTNPRSVIYGNYKIYTYLDQTLQNYIENLFNDKAFSFNNVDFLSLVADNNNGGIKSYQSTSNISLYNLRRQPASVIKPILVYAPALDMCYISPATMLIDEPININGYAPKNYANKYLGLTSIRNAVINSSNSIAVKILNDIGIKNAINIAKHMGLNFDLEDSGLALSLGGMKYGVTMTEITESYMALANEGCHKSINFIKKIENQNGEIVYLQKNISKKIISKESAYLMTDMLIDTTKTGTAKKMGSLPFEIAAKTGTAGTNLGNNDAWNMSYTAESTVCVWFGNLSNSSKSMISKDITGGAYPTILAKYIHSRIPPKRKFEIPDGIIEVDIDTYSSSIGDMPLIATRNTPFKYISTELFDNKNAPFEFSRYFDDAIPFDFLINFYSFIQISFQTKKGFRYKIYKKNLEYAILLSEVDYSILNYVLIDYDLLSGVYNYYVEVYTDDGIYVGKSNDSHIIILSSH